MRRWSPDLWMLSAVLLGVLFGALAVWTAVQQPWLGIVLRADADAGTVRLVAVHPSGPARAAPVPSELASIASADAGRTFVPVADDLVEEPDFFDSYERIETFLSRQAALDDLLRSGPLRLELRAGDGTVHVLDVAPGARPVSDLPVVFWIQLLSGVAALVVGCWVVALRRDDWGARMFALAGAAMLVFTVSAAIYSTRELALDGGLFRLLSALNHIGALTFGAAMIALFLCYPVRLVRPRTLLLLPAVVVPWVAAGIAQQFPGPAWGAQIPTAIEMLGIVAMIGVQRWAVRRDPRGRAALRWLGLSVILGAGAFVTAIVGPVLMGVEPFMSQGYAFLFFLLIYVGLALGVRRYRLFELGEWAFRVMFYMVAALVLLAVDAALILLLQLGPAPSLGIAIALVAFGYLPLRDMLWRRTVGRQPMPGHELFRSVIAVAFDSSAGQRAGRWRDLVHRLFDPLETAPATGAVEKPEIRDDGIELVLPPTADAPALALRYPWRGRGLFGPVHLQLARQLAALMAHAEEGRRAYERGASEERRRIAQDLHDDLGARLLSGLHQPDVDRTRRTLREAIAEVRTIVSGLSGQRLPLSTVVAELRHETAERLDSAGIELVWPLSTVDDDGLLLDYAVYKGFMSAHREIVSNVIRHARASRVTVSLDGGDGRLVATVGDDGVGLGPDRGSGNGLANIGRRIADLGGTLSYPETARGLSVSISLPLHRMAAAAGMAA